MLKICSATGIFSLTNSGIEAKLPCPEEAFLTKKLFFGVVDKIKTNDLPFI